MAEPFTSWAETSTAALSELTSFRPQIVTLPEQHLGTGETGEKSMSSLDLDLDSQMSHLEREWRSAYESSIVARADYQILAASAKASANLLDLAAERLDRSEALKARIMARIERLEDSMLGRD
jgi:hypothetical protein